VAYTSPNRTWVVGETVTAAIMNQYVRDQFAALGRLGKYDFIIAASAGYQVVNIIDNAWAECNNAAILRGSYPDFDALLASMNPVRPFGAGNGSTTVNVPDLFGRTPVALGSNADISSLGASDGSAAAVRSPRHNSTHNLTLPDHQHNIPAYGDSGTADGYQVAYRQSGGVNWPLTGGMFLTHGIDGSIGPGGSRPTDTGGYQVGGIYIVKVKL